MTLLTMLALLLVGCEVDAVFELRLSDDRLVLTQGGVGTIEVTIEQVQGGIGVAEPVEVTGLPDGVVTVYDGDRSQGTLIFAATPEAAVGTVDLELTAGPWVRPEELQLVVLGAQR